VRRAEPRSGGAARSAACRLGLERRKKRHDRIGEPLRPEPQLEWRSSPDQHTVRRALDEADGVIEGMNEVVAVRQDEHGHLDARRCSWVGAVGPTKTPWSTAAITSGESDVAFIRLLSGPNLVRGIRLITPEVTFPLVARSERREVSAHKNSAAAGTARSNTGISSTMLGLGLDSGSAAKRLTLAPSEIPPRTARSHQGGRAGRRPDPRSYRYGTPTHASVCRSARVRVGPTTRPDSPVLRALGDTAIELGVHQQSVHVHDSGALDGP